MYGDSVRFKRRKIATRACDTCRARRTRCDAGAPSCSGCDQRNLVCSYSTVAKKRGPRGRNTSFASSPQSPPLTSALDARPTSATRCEYQSSELVGQLTAPPQSSPPAGSLLELRQSLTPAPPYVEHASARYELASSFSHTWTKLQLKLSLIWGADALADNFSTCIDLYIRHLFPLTPLVDERALRSVASRLQSEASLRDNNRATGAPFSHQAFTIRDLAFGASPAVEAPEATRDLTSGPLAIKRSFTLLVAMCATVASLLPAAMMSPGLKASADCLLQGSRHMLHTFQDQDIEQPCATSVVIRYFHSISTHAAGQLRGSWYILGEAIRVAQDLQVYDEASFSGLPAREVHLRRSLFWQLTTGDRSSAILNSMPFAFCSSNFSQPFSTAPLPHDYDCLLDHARPRNRRQLATLVNTGFNTIALVFQRGAKILLTLRSLGNTSDTSIHTPELDQMHKSTIAGNLGRLDVIIEDLPDWLRRPWTFAAINGRNWEDLDHYSCYIWILYTNIMLTYHSLQLILFKQASEIGQVETFGYSTDASLQALHTLRIAQNALYVMRNSPFEALQLNGEPSVEKVRQIGAILLELSEKSSHEDVMTRSRKHLEEVMALLTRLNSTAFGTLWQRLNPAS